LNHVCPKPFRENRRFHCELVNLSSNGVKPSFATNNTSYTSRIHQLVGGLPLRWSGASCPSAATNHAAFNLANALGRWFGGIAISAGFGWTNTGYIDAATALSGLAFTG